MREGRPRQDSEARSPATDRENEAPTVTTISTEDRSSTRHDDSKRSASATPGPVTEALQRELARARAEGRWADADAVARDLEAKAGVVDLEVEARKRGRR